MKCWYKATVILLKIKNSVNYCQFSANVLSLLSNSNELWFWLYTCVLVQINNNKIKQTIKITSVNVCEHAAFGYAIIRLFTLFWIVKRWGSRVLMAYSLLIPLTSSSSSEKWQSHKHPWTHPRESGADHIHHDAFSFPVSDGKWSDWIPFQSLWMAVCGLRDAAVMSLNNLAEEKGNRWRDDEWSSPHWIWGWLIR